jgi:small GTP-binding protein
MVDTLEERGGVTKILKILFVGEFFAGKTALIRQYAQHSFTEFYKSTIGLDFASKELEWDSNTSISLQLWDIAGEERCGNMTRIYYQEAVAAFVVFDVTNSESLDRVTWWKKDIDEKVFTSADKPIPCFLIGNKIDLCQDGKWAKTDEEMQAFIAQHGFIAFFMTSARTGKNIEEAVMALVKFVLDNTIVPHSAIRDEFVPQLKNTESTGACRC